MLYHHQTGVLFATCITGVCKYAVQECVCVVVYKKICHTIVYRAMYATMQVCAQVGASMSSCTMCELKVVLDRNHCSRSEWAWQMILAR